MSALPPRVFAGALVALCLGVGAATARPTSEPSVNDQELQLTQSGTNPTLHSNSSSLSRGLSKAPTDTFYLYGGPGTLEGKFQDSNGVVPDRQGWIGVDLTDFPVFWQISTFNAENLGGHGAGNNAAWSGRTAAQQPGWTSTPGYGNNWDDRLVFRSGPVADPSVGQTVSLDFVFNYDTEAGYDFFGVEYDSVGSWIVLLSVSGTNAVAGMFGSPGVQYSNLSTRAITYAGGDYGGANGDEVVIRLRFTSDGAWSDEDGLRWPTEGTGAVQVDDISVTWSEGNDFEDFEAGLADMWLPDKKQFVGDFSMVYAKLSDGDLDPCAENFGPMMAFIDVGQIVGNCYLFGHPTPICSTIGQTSPTWNYGEPQGHVVNYTGGLTFGEDALNNEVWSPEILWDLPGTADDGTDVMGAAIRYTMWDHLEILNGIIPTWHVRSSTDGVAWSQWRDRNFIFFINSGPAWRNREYDVTDLLEPNPLKVQIALGVVDVADIWGFPGNDATPAPAYDNVSFIKYRVGGPNIRALRQDLAHDGFPPVGSLDVSTMAARNALDIPFDMVRDVGSGAAIDTGDSIVVDVTTAVPNTTVADLRMVWVLDRNPLFEDAIRSLPARAVDENVTAGPTQWSGEVASSPVTNSQGAIIADKFFFDLPGVDFLYPGDRLRYFIQATDSDGRISTLPDDTNGFTNGAGYSRTYTVRGLPSMRDAAGTQPTKLVLDLSDGRGNPAALFNALHELGLIEGLDYDIYTEVRPTGGYSNGVGAGGGHGATAAQLSGYDTIVAGSANHGWNVLSDGSDAGSNDKSDDLGLLTAWHALPGLRNVAYFGDGLAGAVANGGSAGAIYAQDVLGVSFVDVDVRDEILMQTTPATLPIDFNFATEFVTQGGCPYINRFDSIRALPGSLRGHAFTDPAGTPLPDIAASVIHDRIENGDRKVDITFPFGLSTVSSPTLKAPTSTTTLTKLLREVFSYFGVVSGGETATAPRARAVRMSVYPNPFNPRTVVRFTGLAAGASGSVRIYNTRGELVVTLHDGEFSESEFVWDGTDSNGRNVASGVYMIEGRAGDFRQVEKVAVLK